jgi:hypothetical protein
MSKFLLNILAEQGQKHSILARPPIFFQGDPIETRTIRCRIKFRIQHRAME